MDRRTALNRITLVLGATVSAPTMAALFSSCSTPVEGYEARALAPDLFDWVARAAETIIPETETPGALTAGVHRYVDQLLAEYFPPEESQALIQGLGLLQARVTDPGAMLAEVDAEAYGPGYDGQGSAEGYTDLQAYRQLKELVITGYYTSQLCELDPMPMGTWESDVPYSEIGRAWA